MQSVYFLKKCLVTCIQNVNNIAVKKNNQIGLPIYEYLHFNLYGEGYKISIEYDKK